MSSKTTVISNGQWGCIWDYAPIAGGATYIGTAPNNGSVIQTGYSQSLMDELQGGLLFEDPNTFGGLDANGNVVNGQYAVTTTMPNQQSPIIDFIWSPEGYIWKVRSIVDDATIILEDPEGTATVLNDFTVYGGNSLYRAPASYTADGSGTMGMSFLDGSKVNGGIVLPFNNGVQEGTLQPFIIYANGGDVTVVSYDANILFQPYTPPTPGGVTAPIATTYNTWIGLIQSNSLTPGAWYVFNDLLSSAEYFYFYAIDTQRINPEGIYYPIGINGQSDVPAIQVVLQIDQNGTVAGNTFDYFYEPINNNKFYGYPYAMGDTSGTRQFFDKLMGLDGNYTNNVVCENVFFFASIPIFSKNCVYRSYDGGYTLGSNVRFYYCDFAQNGDYSINAGDNVDCQFVNFGSAGHDIGANAIIKNVQTTAKDGIHYFPASSTTKDGVVGGRGCSAEFETVIDLGSTNLLDLSDKPLCKTYHIANVDPLGLTTITGWNYAENHGAKILILPSATITVKTDGTGNIYASSNVINGGGGLFISVANWVTFLLNHDGNPYATDYI